MPDDSLPPWTRPSGGPARHGDKSARPIYEAIGRAVSNWEGAEVAALILFAALTTDEKDIANFSRTFSIRDRAIQLRRAASSLPFSEGNNKEVANLKVEIEALVDAYEGWSERRNDVAHGCVTPMWSPDYANPECPTVRTFSVCPSHANKKKWFAGDPIYNLNASEIRAFARAFVVLDKQFEQMAKRVRAVTAV